MPIRHDVSISGYGQRIRFMFKKEWAGQEEGEVEGKREKRGRGRGGEEEGERKGVK